MGIIDSKSKILTFVEEPIVAFCITASYDTGVKGHLTTVGNCKLHKRSFGTD